MHLSARSCSRQVLHAILSYILQTYPFSLVIILRKLIFLILLTFLVTVGAFLNEQTLKTLSINSDKAFCLSLHHSTRGAPSECRRHRKRPHSIQLTNKQHPNTRRCSLPPNLTSRYCSKDIYYLTNSESLRARTLIHNLGFVPGQAARRHSQRLSTSIILPTPLSRTTIQHSQHSRNASHRYARRPATFLAA